MELLTAQQMREIEAAAIASGAVTGADLMERAGRGVVEAIFEEWPALRATSHRAVVLCGPGNNGGDGFVVARLLKGWGWDVEVFLYGDPQRMPPDARANYERWLGMGEVIPITGDTTLRTSAGAKVALYIDAVFGIGLTRPLDPMLSENFFGVLSGKMGGAEMWPVFGGYKVVAIDVPSGLCADSGRLIREVNTRLNRQVGLTCEADLTVTFDWCKRGHLMGQGPACCGKVVIAPIGLKPPPQTGLFPSVRDRRKADSVPKDAVRRVDLCAPAREAQMWRGQLNKAGANLRAGHKFTHGHALILSGAGGRGGAARLAARGALRIGAGVVTVGCPPDAIAEHAARLDAVMVRAVADGAALADALGDGRINALCLGPAMGVDDRAAGLVAAALQCPGGLRSTVLDADALTLLAQDGALFGRLHPACVLTPHAGEFARLFPDIAAELAAPATIGPAYSKVDACREAAARAGCVVLFKGPDTVIADPAGRCAVNSADGDRAAPWLATAGSGDVLAGFVAGLLARGFDPFGAACTAAWLHVDCARRFGPGLIAEDLPEMLPAVLRRLLDGLPE